MVLELCMRDHSDNVSKAAYGRPMDEKLVLHWLQRLVWNGVVVADGAIVVMESRNYGRLLL